MDKLAHYRIETTLGQGAMGVVYRAIDERLDRTVALKVLRLNLTPEERSEYAPRLQQEARSAARLNHPNIITVYDCGDVDGHAYLAIEYVEGKTLQALMEAGVKLSTGRVVKLARQLFSALDYAHEHHVVHRDIKPANLMLTADGRLKITDFGIAQLPTSDLTRAGTIVGSPRYMAPEQIEGKKLDGRADLFAAGIVLYQVLTGQRPFDGDHVATIAYRILHEAPVPIHELNPDVPDWLGALVMRCLEKDPAKRYQRAREARAELREHVAPASSGSAAGEKAVAAAVAAPASAEAAAAAEPRGAVAASAGASGKPHRKLPWLALALGGVLAVGAALAMLVRPAAPMVVLEPSKPPMAQAEMLEPPGAPGSLPASAAMPVRAEGPDLATSTPAADPAAGTDEDAAARPANTAKSTAKPGRKLPEKTAPVAARPAEPVQPVHVASEPDPTPAPAAPADKGDEKGLWQKLTGCSEDGSCPQAKKVKRDR
ncbi:serine/threonine-protein kinase [Chitinimonas koreensis]|uniref:serine/threonine-protein kinase n=1 Tax=Chitinimonas koreensis TaxID=356302 RepID=UPI00040CAC9A|nr:serine/threonine-protein kinase [Chitinimonas koreensis]QNM97901.1 protein kinase [Chitinimonas koreensis]